MTAAACHGRRAYPPAPSHQPGATNSRHLGELSTTLNAMFPRKRVEVHRLTTKPGCVVTV